MKGIRRVVNVLWRPSRRRAVMLLFVACLSAAVPLRAAEIVIYGFEGTLDGWVIPDWEKSSPDYVAQEHRVSPDRASEGQHALELQTAFPTDSWAGAYVERAAEVTDWSAFRALSMDVYLPGHAPKGLAVKVILTIGEQWTWTEMNRAIPLTPGAWTTITVNLKPGSLDWKFFPTEAFRKDIRKVGIRIEAERGTAYRGSVFIDNIRLAD